MKKVLCENNHYYDADTYASCPHCAKNREWEKNHVDPNRGKTEQTAISSPTKKRKISISKTFIITVVVAGVCLFTGGICIWGFQPKELIVNPSAEMKTYYIGDSLDVNSLTVELENNFGLSKTINESWEYSPRILDSAGNQTITISYEDLSSQMNVYVSAIEIEDIRILTLPVQTEYFTGEKLNIDGLTLEVMYSDGHTETVDEGITLVTEEFTSAGEKKAVITYADTALEYPVRVQEVALEKVSIKTLPDRKMFHVGENLDTTGLELTAEYNNGETQTVDSGYTCSIQKFSSIGEQKISVMYEGKTAIYSVLVKNRPYIQDVYTSLMNWGNEGIITRRLESINVEFYDIVATDFQVECSWTDDLIYYENYVTSIHSDDPMFDGVSDIFQAMNDFLDNQALTLGDAIYSGQTIYTQENFDSDGNEETNWAKVSIYLPDDSTAEGDQWIKLTLGDNEYTVSFHLEYTGDHAPFDNGYVYFLWDESDIEYVNPEASPFEQTYWVIFTEGFRNDRVEASTIDSTLPADKLHIVWNSSLELNNKSGASDCLQYYLDDNNKWVSIGDYHLLSSKATNVIASNLDIYDKNGNLILKKSQYKDIDWNVIDSYKN